MSKTSKWILGYFIAYLATFFIFPLTSRILTMSFLIMLLALAPTYFVQKEKWHGLVSIITLVIIFVSFSYLVVSAVPVFMNGVQTFQEQFKEFSTDDILKNFPNLPDWIRETAQTSLDKLGESFGNFLFDTGVYISKNLPTWITYSVLLIVAAAFLVISGYKLRKKIPILFPGCEIDKVRSFFYLLLGDLQRYVGGQLIIAVIVGSVIGLGALITGISGAVFLGLLAGVTNLIPFLGVIISAIPTLILGYTTKGLIGIVIAAIILIFANQLEMWFLSPKIMAERLKINWFIILITLLAFAELFGAFGIVLALPFIIFVRRFWLCFITKSRRGDLK
ncbi:MAG: AI-2E family transporter [Kosmotogaceae bacterium]